jgi:ribonuclease P protein component
MSAYRRDVAAATRFPRSARLTLRRDFDAVFATGTRVHGTLLTLAGRRREGDLRLGIACGKRFSKRAVDRNRFRRLVREAFRIGRPALRGGLDLVAMPRCKPGEATFLALTAELPELLGRLERKLARP